MAITTAKRPADLYECRRDEFLVSTDRSRLDLNLIHHFLTDCDWARGIPKKTVARSVEHSLCFGMYNADKQAGFARLIPDYATHASPAADFALEPYRAHARR